MERLLALVCVLTACDRWGYGPLPLRSDGGASVAAGAGASPGLDGSGGISFDGAALQSGDTGSSGSGAGGFAGASGEAGAQGANGGAGAQGATEVGSSGGSASGGSSGSGPGGTGGAAPIPSACTDGLQNGAETAVDCGGPGCAPCACTFAAPERLGSPNRPGSELWAPTLSSDGLTMYMGIAVAGGSEQIYVATRPDRGNTFAVANLLMAPVNQVVEGTPQISRDGLSLYFYSARDGGAVNRELYVATRANATSTFNVVSPLTTLNSSSLDHLPWLSPDELVIYFATDRAGNSDVWSATRASRAQSFAAPAPVSELNSVANDNRVTLTDDELMILLASDRSGTGWDLYQSVRARRDEPFSPPEPIDALNTTHMEADPALSPDGLELFFTSTRSGETEIWRSQRTCP